MKQVGTIDQQDYSKYTETDHSVWNTCYHKVNDSNVDRADIEYLKGLEACNVTDNRIPKFSEISSRLKKATGWEIVGSTGLISSTEFFTLLSNKRFPVTTWIRTPEQMEYLQEPDLFHDFYGHVPLLFNPTFSEYLQWYGKQAIKFPTNRLSRLARLYWFTTEFGLIKRPEGMRIYGAGILSSFGEVEYSLSNKSNKVKFNLARLLRSKYIISDYQPTYFVIESYDELFDAVTNCDFEKEISKAEELGDIQSGEIISEDILY